MISEKAYPDHGAPVMGVKQSSSVDHVDKSSKQVPKLQKISLYL